MILTSMAGQVHFYCQKNVSKGNNPDAHSTICQTKHRLFLINHWNNNSKTRKVDSEEDSGDFAGSLFQCGKKDQVIIQVEIDKWNAIQELFELSLQW